MAGDSRQKGRVINWNARRGFGFVAPAEGGEPLFLHITAIRDRRRAPAEGDMVTYEVAYDEKTRRRAVDVKWSVSSQPKPRGKAASPAGAGALLVTLLFTLFVIAVTLVGRLPPTVISAYAVMGLVTFLVYWWDKTSARHGLWRTRESTLLVLGLVGGWPGAVVAQRMFRHKTSKNSFQAAFWATVVINFLLLVWLLTNGGSMFLEQLLK